MKRFLVIEDDPPLARAIAATLRGLDVAVDVCGDAEEALHWLEERAYALIVVDVNLPEASGGEIVVAIRRAEHRNEHAKIIMISGGERLSFLSAACGADGYLTKPFRKAELLALVTELLSKPPLDAPGG